MDSDEDKDKEFHVNHINSVHVRTHSSEEEGEEEEPKNDDHIIKQIQKDEITLEIPNIDETIIPLNNQETILDGYEAAEDSFNLQEIKTPLAHDHQLSDDEEDEEETIIQRINSNQNSNSLQLGRQLSCKWSTGAGPRIGYLRDYPSELQSHALEEANLSPKSAPCSLRYTNTMLCTSPFSFENRSLLRRNKRPYRTQSTPLDIGCIDF